MDERGPKLVQSSLKSSPGGFGYSRLVMAFLLIGVFAIAIYIRLNALVIGGGLMSDGLSYDYYVGITPSYLSMRDSILGGHWNELTTSYPIGYPLFLAILSSVGVDKLGQVRLLQALLDAGAVFPLFLVVRSLTGASLLALASACIYALGIWWAAGSTYLLAEWVVPAMVIVLLSLMVWVRAHPDNLWRWCLVGLVSVVLPFFRPSMTLLIFPLVLWAMLVTSRKKRLWAAVFVGAAFVLPLVGWAVRNYFVTGEMFFTPSAKWYALWSGLGQLPNPFGYFTNDKRAGTVLAQQGLVFHSSQAEAFFRHKYLMAWKEHPFYVMRTIWYRFTLIATKPDLSQTSYDWLWRIVYVFLALSTPFALLGLLWKRRFSDAFIVVGPLGYALLSLGPMYVETRYVRYASVTYILAAPVLVSLVVDEAYRRFGTRLPSSGGTVKATVGAFALAALLFLGAWNLPSLRDQAEAAALKHVIVDNAANDDRRPVLHKFALDRIWGKTKLAKTSEGERLTSEQDLFHYMSSGQLPIEMPRYVQIRYSLEIRSGGVLLGILSDRKRWLTQEVVTQKNKTMTGVLVARANPGAALFLSVYNENKEPVDVTIKRLDFGRICLGRPIHPLLMLFERHDAIENPAMSCPAGSS